MPEWAMEFKAFLIAVKRHWVLLVTSSIFAASGFLYEHTTKPIPIEIIWGAAIVFLVISCFLAWRDEYRKVLSRHQRRTIREGLAVLHERGVGLLLECERIQGAVSDEEVRSLFAIWDRDGQAYLLGKLDRSYVTRFNNPVGLHLQYAVLASGERTRIWGHVANRTARLQQFMDDYRDS